MVSRTRLLLLKAALVLRPLEAGVAGLCSLSAAAPAQSLMWAQPRTFSANSAAPARPILPRGRGYAKGIRRRPSVVAEAAATARFFADEGITYETLGLHHEVVTALEQLQLPRPAHIQALTAPVLLTGKNAVVAAETGSGKTLAYVAPIASMLLRQKRRQATSARPFQFHALVLLPNGPLCQQLVSVVQSLRDTTGQPLLTAAQVNSSNPPPQEPPDFITATPAGLLTLLEEAGPAYGKLWTLEGLQTRVKHVVLDEADLLMTAAYSRVLNRLLQALRSGDRRLVEAKLFTELQLSEGDFARLPRKLQVAAWTGGSSALLAAGYRPPEPPAPDAQFGPYWRRQYVFVAATMPAVTLHDVGTQIEKLYPDAEWVATPSLHTSKTQVEHAWQQVSDADCVKHLLKAVCDDPDYRAGKAKTLVFVNDVAQADHVSQLFQENQIAHEVYHKKLDSAALKLSLERMKSGESGVMISTDASSRGIDIPDVTHIVQAECAPNAIAFLHRVGRTGRAGKQGKVTTLYREENLPLVEVLKQFIAEGRPLEAAFSRNRSFSKKYSRMGDTFVPRGMSSSTFKSLMSAPAP
ncbi:P-loop containing nucleoside triphosphate hydrolase protein [Haematococcus lacustris]